VHLEQASGSNSRGKFNHWAATVVAQSHTQHLQHSAIAAAAVGPAVLKLMAAVDESIPVPERQLVSHHVFVGFWGGGGSVGCVVG
jgi:hypothetical protein